MVKKMADLKFLGRITGFIGGILLLLFGIVGIIRNFGNITVDLGLLEYNLISGFVGTEGWIITVAILIICGIVAVFGYKQLSGRKEGGLLLWGIIFTVIGLIAGTLGGLIVLIGGIVLIIDYFL